MKTKTKVWILAVVALLLVIGALVGTKALQIGTMMKAGESFVMPPTAVTAATAEKAQWEAIRTAVGSVVAVRGVTLGSELGGTVREIGFDSGASVTRGTTLVRLDTSTEEAQLAAAKAEAALARVSLKRARALREAGSSAQAELDTAEARAAAADAQVAALQAAISKKVIRAPFDGRLAIREVELGQVVGAGAQVASLQSVDPIFVEFWVPQQALAEIAVGQKVRIRTDVYGDTTWDGKISVVNPQVDPQTRNVRVRATFANRDGRLRPGMFANVEAVSFGKQDVVVVPATAILFAPYGDSVFAIAEKKGQDGKTALVAEQKFVRTGERRGDFVVVQEGLTAGERIVASGAFKLRNGAPLEVKDPELAPPAKLDPKPQDR